MKYILYRLIGVDLLDQVLEVDFAQVMCHSDQPKFSFDLRPLFPAAVSASHLRDFSDFAVPAACNVPGWY